MELAPSLLISVPQMRDPNFDHTVVLILEHDEAGSFGLVLNRETDHTMLDFCRIQSLDYRGSAEARIHFGGPVGTTQGFVLYGAPNDVPEDQEGQPVRQGIWFGTDLDLLALLAAQTRTPYRLLLGYAGWAPGQLDAELAAGGWIARPAEPHLVFGTPAGAMWDRALAEMGIDPGTIVRVEGGGEGSAAN